MLPMGRAPGVPTEGSRLVTVSSGGLRSLTRSPSHEGRTRRSAPNFDGGEGCERAAHPSIQIGPNGGGPCPEPGPASPRIWVCVPLDFPGGRVGEGVSFAVLAPCSHPLLAPCSHP